MRAALSVAMSCHFTSTHFHLLRVLAGQTERSAAREAICLQGARLCLWTAHPDPAQRHRAHASGTRRAAWHFKKNRGGVGRRKQLSQRHPPPSVDCPGRQRAGLSCRPRSRGDPCALEGGPPEGAGSKREEWSDFRAASDHSARRVSSSTIDCLRSCSPSCFFQQRFVNWYAKGRAN